MTSYNVDDPGAESSELKGLVVLLVEDSWQLGMAMKKLLCLLGADVVGPAATAAEAERMVSERTPDVALVDFNLRGGERANALIDRLHARGIRVVVTTGYAEVPLAAGKTAAILQKPISESQLIESLLPLVAEKAAR
jgi:DNA-binding NtrC family response regulator